MANAWLLKPLIPASVTTAGTLQLGSGANAFNDYAGVVCELTTDSSGSSAFVRIDLGADTLIDTVMVFGVQFIPFDASVVVYRATTAQGPFTGAFSSDTTTPYVGSAGMTSGKGVTLLALATPVTARYLQITYIGAASTQTVRFSRVVVGKRIAWSAISASAGHSVSATWARSSSTGAE